MLFKRRWIPSWFEKRSHSVTPPVSLAIPEAAITFLRRIPKAEIHLHFEGTLSAETILRLGKKYQVGDIRTRSDAEWCLYFSHAQQFFERFLFVSSLLREPEDFYIAALDLGNRLAEENIRYAEITLAPHKFLRQGMDYSQMLDAMDRGLKNARDGRRREYRIIIDVVRDLGPEAGLEMMREVERFPHPQVVGIGLGGSEAFPPEQSMEVYEFAETLGLRKTAHAGEGRGPASIWGALRFLKVERIDHGVRAREDSELVAYLVEHRIPLNLCPTSNVMLGLFPSLEEHPFRFYYDRGIPVTIGTDDPAFFKTTLTEELIKLVAYQGLRIEQIPDLMSNALRASFLPDPLKQKLLADFASETKDHLPQTVNKTE